MSIYISIPTLTDNQLIYTIQDIFNNASNPKDIHVGIAFMTDESYYLNFLKKIKKYKNIKTKHFDVKTNVGVGLGRHNAASMYDNQDYILQIDSHTHFTKNWDSLLLKMYDQALEETKNKKTILTAYLAPFLHSSNGERILVRKSPGYPVFQKEFWDNTTKIPRWTDYMISDFPDSLKTNKKFIPCVKFNANFAFGNKHFALDNHLDKNVIFMEEEIVQTINLLGDGFSLVFPNQTIPCYHLYDNIKENIKESYRNSIYDLYDESKFPISIKENFNNFINNPDNFKKIKIFEKYSQVDLKNGARYSWYTPKEYNYD